MNETFGKSYKLCSKKVIDALFQQGKSIKSFPLRMVYHQTELPSDKVFQLGISVPKKIFKRAPHRNKIKRLIREGVRKNKHLLEGKINPTKQLALFLIYSNKEIISYQEMERKIVQLFERLQKEIEKEKLS